MDNLCKEQQQHTDALSDSFFWRELLSQRLEQPPKKQNFMELYFKCQHKQQNYMQNTANLLGNRKLVVFLLQIFLDGCGKWRWFTISSTLFHTDRINFWRHASSSCASYSSSSCDFFCFCCQGFQNKLATPGVPPPTWLYTCIASYSGYTCSNIVFV